MNNTYCGLVGLQSHSIFAGGVGVTVSAEREPLSSASLITCWIFFSKQTFAFLVIHSHKRGRSYLTDGCSLH